MPSKNTSITLLMDELLEDKNRSSSQKNIDSKKDLLESTQMADDQSLANIADPLNNVSDTYKEATVVLGNTRTILSDQASSKENIEDSAFKENVSEQYNSLQSEQNQAISIRKNEFVPSDDQVNFDKTNNIDIEGRDSAVISNLQNQPEEHSKISHLHEVDLTDFALPDPIEHSSPSLSDFMEHANSSQSEESLETPSISQRSQTHPSPAPSIPTNSPLSNEEESSQNLLSARAVLERADQLKIAQDRINELESVVFSLRQENTGLSSEIETLKQHVEELSSTLDATERRNRIKVESLSDERNLLEESLFQKNKEYNNLKLKIEELKKRLAKDLKSVRVREIELENRLELVKQEKTALLKNKDEIILDLKRKTDHLTMDIDSYRKKNQSAQIHISESEERVQRSVRALRLALGMLEGSNTVDSNPPVSTSLGSSPPNSDHTGDGSTSK